METKDDSKDRAGLIFHIVSEDDLKPGDHIYIHRFKGIYYKHHGIYIGEPGMEVIHITGKTGAGSSSIQSCTLEEFKGSASICLVAYDVSPFASLYKNQETVHLCKSRPSKDVIETAKYFLRHPAHFGKYHVLFNNCETFAVYCKTEMVLPSSQIMPFRNIVESLLAFEDNDDDQD